MRFWAAGTLQPVFCQRMQKIYSVKEWQTIILKNEKAKTNAMEKCLFLIRNNNVINEPAILNKILFKKWHLLTASFILFVLKSETKQPTDWGSELRWTFVQAYWRRATIIFRSANCYVKTWRIEGFQCHRQDKIRLARPTNRKKLVHSMIQPCEKRIRQAEGLHLRFFPFSMMGR